MRKFDEFVDELRSDGHEIHTEDYGCDGFILLITNRDTEVTLHWTAEIVQIEAWMEVEAPISLQLAPKDTRTLMSII